MRPALFICASTCILALGPASAQKPASDWTTLFDGTTLDHFNRVGNANWKLGGGGPGFLVTKETYANFELRVEFWVDEGANSGVYMRCQDGTQITDKTCYEANIFDKRPDQSEGGTSATLARRRQRALLPERVA